VAGDRELCGAAGGGGGGLTPIITGARLLPIVTTKKQRHTPNIQLPRSLNLGFHQNQGQEKDSSRLS
jgi:hypothetical protein